MIGLQMRGAIGAAGLRKLTHSPLNENSFFQVPEAVRFCVFALTTGGSCEIVSPACFLCSLGF